MKQLALLFKLLCLKLYPLRTHALTPVTRRSESVIKHEDGATVNETHPLRSLGHLQFYKGGYWG